MARARMRRWLGFWLVLGTQAVHVIHVATTGNDNDPGTSQLPLRTFGAAQAMARGFPPDTNVTVQFSAGTYAVSETQVLTSLDSGAEGTPRVYTAAPGATVTLAGDVPVRGWRSVRDGDAAWSVLDDDARANVMVAPLPQDVPLSEVPNMLFDAAAEVAAPSKRAVRTLPNTNVVSGLVPTAGQDSEFCVYLGQHRTEAACRAAALSGGEGIWAYAWHDPAIITDDFGGGCYGRRERHGSRAFLPQDGVMSAVMPPSNGWREVTDWDISDLVTTQHRCDGAECEYFDSEADKSAMHMHLTRDQLQDAVRNDADALSLRIYLVDFAMNVLPIAAIESGAANGTAVNASTPSEFATDGGSSTVRTAYPGTLLLGQKPGYCDTDPDEGRCTPALWLLNTMRFDMPGQFAVNTVEGTVYYWPALASGDVSGVSVAATSTLVSLRGDKSKPDQGAVEHVKFVGINFARGNRVKQQRGPEDAGGIQHDWASLQSSNALLTLDTVRDVTIEACGFSSGGGGGVRADGLAQRVRIANSTFRYLGHEAIGLYGLGLGVTQLTDDNTIELNDVSATAMVKFDAPALVLWNAAHTVVHANYVHDTASRALYIGGSRYCTRQTGFATDGGILMNNWDELVDDNIPAAWLATCANNSYAYTFGADCKCSFFRGAHGSVVRHNVFARVSMRKDRPFFSDGIVYISGPGYIADKTRDVTVFEDNTYLSTPGEGAPAWRLLYVDGYTGSMHIARNAAAGANAHQGFMLCNWYGRSTVTANALQIGDAGWGADYEISVNCDGNPVLDTQGNLVLSDESSPAHNPDVNFVDQYTTMYDTVCAASKRASAPSTDFLQALNTVITSLGSPTKQCS